MTNEGRDAFPDPSVGCGDAPAARGVRYGREATVMNGDPSDGRTGRFGGHTGGPGGRTGGLGGPTGEPGDHTGGPGDHTGGLDGRPGGRDRARRRGQGELEAQVLAALHQAPGPATAAWVQDHLGGDLAYTTVMTILSRLHAKKAVTRERDGRSYVWLPAADEAGLAALRMRRVLDSESDRDAVLASFVSALSAQDEQLLRTLLERATGEDSGPDATGPDPGRPPLGD